MAVFNFILLVVALYKLDSLKRQLSDVEQDTLELNDELTTLRATQ